MSAAITRIPLTIVATATGQKTDNVLVGVLASDLDALEAARDDVSPGVAQKMCEHVAALGSVLAALEAEFGDELATDGGDRIDKAYREARAVRDRWLV